MKNLGVAGWIPARMGRGKQTYPETEVGQERGIGNPHYCHSY